MKRNFFLILSALIFLGCSEEKKEGFKETRTSGTLTILVDETVSDIIDEQIEVFQSDYKETLITLKKGNEGNIITAFLNDTTRYMVLTRPLTDKEERVYASRKIPVFTDRFAIDGIALITQKNSVDSNITVQQLIDMMKGNGPRNKSLVFDNAYSSTIRYFKEMAGVSTLPKNNAYTLNNNKEVIKYVAENPGYIGVIGLNWFLSEIRDEAAQMDRIMLMNVKNLPGKKGDSSYYKPSQAHIMSGIYPLLRNIYVINAEGRDGLGTGFATWLTSNRGQLIIMRSGLAPNIVDERVINFITKN